MKKKKTDCENGYKPCGKRCVPEEWKCKGGVGVPNPHKVKELKPGASAARSRIKLALLPMLEAPGTPRSLAGKLIMESINNVQGLLPSKLVYVALLRSGINADHKSLIRAVTNSVVGGLVGIVCDRSIQELGWQPELQTEEELIIQQSHIFASCAAWPYDPKYYEESIFQDFSEDGGEEEEEGEEGEEQEVDPDAQATEAALMEIEHEEIMAQIGTVVREEDFDPTAIYIRNKFRGLLATDFPQAIKETVRLNLDEMQDIKNFAEQSPLDKKVIGVLVDLAVAVHGMVLVIRGGKEQEVIEKGGLEEGEEVEEQGGMFDKEEDPFEGFGDEEE